MSDNRFPSYQKPPVIEVVIGAQFKSEKPIQTGHIGLFWERIRTEYPKLESAPPLQEVHEGDVRPIAGDVGVSFIPAATVPRSFFIDQSDCWLVQLQPDRLLHNWRLREEASYPRFATVEKRFHNVWDLFVNFCETEAIGDLTVTQLEVTYINHIPVGAGWENLSELNRVFRFLAGSKQEFLPAPEIAWMKFAYPLPEKQGRLHISTRLGMRRSDNCPVLLCELTARGLPRAETEEVDVTDVTGKWIRLAHEWIVRGFQDIMTDEIQDAIWKRIKQ